MTKKMIKGQFPREHVDVFKIQNVQIFNQASYTFFHNLHGHSFSEMPVYNVTTKIRVRIHVKIYRSVSENEESVQKYISCI